MKLVRTRPLFAAALALLLGGLGALVLASSGSHSDAASEDAEKQRLGLMTSLPIYWSEVSDFSELLGQGGDDAHDGHDGQEGHGSPQHWVRTLLQKDYTLVPLDSLHGGGDGAVASELAALDLLLLAQPHTLVPLDNVALDSWVRDGGTLLMFSDPMLTEHSHFGFGDKRRPQDIGLVPPVFARWGLAQNFVDGQPLEGEVVAASSMQIPVNQRGTFSLLPSAEMAGDKCVLIGEGLIAECRIGGGRAFLIADAAVLDSRNGEGNTHSLQKILQLALEN